MKIQVNGAWREVTATQLARALEDLGYGASIVTTALNGDFVAAPARERTPLAEGDRLEVLAPMQGG
jgi:sulfur carrier protein